MDENKSTLLDWLNLMNKSVIKNDITAMRFVFAIQLYLILVSLFFFQLNRLRLQVTRSFFDDNSNSHQYKGEIKSSIRFL